MSPATALVLSALVAVAALLGCGSDEQKAFTAESFIEEANSADAGLILGEPLIGRAGVTLRAVRFEGTGQAPAAGGARDVHGAGTLTVLDDDEAATAEYERCQAAGLTCYRVDNVVLIFSGGVVAADLERLEAALRELGE